MDIQSLEDTVIGILKEVKAENIRVFDTTRMSILFDRLIIASGTSNRQNKALASRVADHSYTLEVPYITVEGKELGEWVIVDLGDLVVHIMIPIVRQYYNLEKMWSANDCLENSLLG